MGVLLRMRTPKGTINSRKHHLSGPAFLQEFRAFGFRGAQVATTGICAFRPGGNILVAQRYPLPFVLLMASLIKMTFS